MRGVALTEPVEVASRAGLEPATLGLEVRCAIHCATGSHREMFALSLSKCRGERRPTPRAMGCGPSALSHSAIPSRSGAGGGFRTLTPLS